MLNFYVEDSQCYSAHRKQASSAAGNCSFWQRFVL